MDILNQDIVMFAEEMSNEKQIQGINRGIYRKLQTTTKGHAKIQEGDESRTGSVSKTDI